MKVFANTLVNGIQANIKNNVFIYSWHASDKLDFDDNIFFISKWFANVLGTDGKQNSLSTNGTIRSSSHKYTVLR